MIELGAKYFYLHHEITPPVLFFRKLPNQDDYRRYCITDRPHPDNDRCFDRTRWGDPTVTEWSPSTGSQETWQTSLPAQCKFAMKNVMSCFHMSMCCMNKAFSS